MEQASMARVDLDRLLTSPGSIYKEPGFKGVRPIQKEQLPSNVQTLCDVLGTKLVEIATGDRIVIDITHTQNSYMDMVADMTHFEDYDVQTVHVFFQRKLLQALYPGKSISFIGASDEDNFIPRLQENYQSDKSRLKFFAAHDGHFGVAAWTVR
jgi:hypothetical protein